MCTTLFEMAPITETVPTWDKFNGPLGIGKIGATYVHNPSGMMVHHCGHPTANFPYYITTPNHERILATNGRGFQRLELAKQHVEELHRKERA